MKKIFLILTVFAGQALNAQTVVQLLNLSDSTKIRDAKIEIKLERSKTKALIQFSDSNGRAKFTLPAETSFELLVTKNGFKPLFTTLQKTSALIEVYLKPLVYDGEEVTVSATRAGSFNIGTTTQLTKKELAERNFGQDIPVLLSNIPSSVTTSDAGAGIGYTGIRIRGIDPTRINVSINGVPLNDPESQGVFWVNMPDFASGINDIEVQRGVGTSSFGTGAFGAAINIKTDKFSENPYATLNLSGGSFNTRSSSIKFGTGRLKNDWFTEGRISWINSDGFIDRAASDLQSWYFSSGKKTTKSLFQVNIFSGSEKTFQAWNGVPMAKYKEDSLGLDSFITWQYYDSTRAGQLRTSDPYTYNYYTYANSTDNYQQSHVQIVYNQSLKKNNSINAVLHGTLGKGYYENFEDKAYLANYLDTPVLFQGNSFEYGNLTHRRWLDNRFVGGIVTYNQKRVRFEQVVGAAFNVYEGKHFGEVIWHEFAEQPIEQNYYDNSSLKTETNAFWKGNYRVNIRLTTFADVQIREVNYSWFGPTDLGDIKQQSTHYLFLNPKAGIQYQRKSNQLMYLTFGRASREPVRDDFINSDRKSRPKPEFMNNIEAAFKSSVGDLKYSITGFYMGYKDQLAITGKINDVGGYTRINIPKSHRIGLEIETSLKINDWIKWDLNLALSRNKIDAFTEYVDDYNTGLQTEFKWKNTDLALSPSRIIGSQLNLNFTKNIRVILLSKYVSRQYLDNTQNKSRSLDPYLINDLVIHFHPTIKSLRSFGLGLMLNNIGNKIYASNGYSYSGMIDNQRRDFSFVYPQAGTNFLIRLTIGI